MDEDIRWHICYSSEKELPNLNFLNEDKRIILYKVDCLDTEAFAKRNAALEKISDGYFCFLDDDTIFHENMYIKYKECQDNGFTGMLIGQQLDSKNKLRLLANQPIHRGIDTGNVLCHHSAIKNLRYPSHHDTGKNDKDYLFWKSIFEFFGKKCRYADIPISYYNMISKINKQVVVDKNTAKILRVKNI